MVDNNLQVVFLHPNKCGGKSIEKALFGREVKPGSADHRLPKHYIRDLGRDNFNSYYKFAFRRNTWDRMVSIYHGRQQLLGSNKGISFEEFLNLPPSGFNKSQLDWFMYDGDFILDFCGRFENYREDWEKVLEQIGVGHIPLPHENKSKHNHYTEYYTDKTRNIVAGRYREEIEFFNFKFGE